MIIEFNEDEELLEEIDDSLIEWDTEVHEVYYAGRSNTAFNIDDLVNDFVIFTSYMFKRLGFENPTNTQLEIAKFLGSNNDKDKMIQAMRGIGKSMLTQLYVLWRLLRNNNEHILVRSASSKRSRNFTTFVLNLIKTTPVLQHLSPRSDQRKSTELFDINGAKPSDSPSLMSAGISANVTGLRASLIIADDIEVQGNANTADMREKLIEQFNESINLLIESDEISGEVIILGTPQTADSIYTQLINTGAYDVFMIPSEYVDIDDWYGNKLAPFIRDAIKLNPDIIGTAVDTRFNMEVLHKRKMRIGKSNYALQYLMNPIVSDENKYPLKMKDLIIYDIDPTDNPIRFIYSSEEKLKSIKHRGFTSDYCVAPAWMSDDRAIFQYTTLAIDPSGKGSDDTGWVVMSLMGGKIFVRDFGGYSGGYDDDTLDSLVAIAKKYDVNKIIVESNFGDGAYLKMLEKRLIDIHNCETEDVRATTQKEARIIDMLEPLMNQHRIIVDRSAIDKDFDRPSAKSLTYQLTHLTRDRGSLVHDDLIDVWEIGAKDMIEYLAMGEKMTLVRAEDDKASKIADMFKNGLFPHLATNLSTNSYMTKY